MSKLPETCYDCGKRIGLNTGYTFPHTFKWRCQKCQIKLTNELASVDTSDMKAYKRYMQRKYQKRRKMALDNSSPIC